MPNQRQRVILTVTGLLGLVALVLGLFISQQVHLNKKAIDPSLFHGTLLPTPRAVGAFTLMGTDNKPFTNASLEGHWTLMFFGFTQCESLCPTTMAILGKMIHRLEQKGVTPLPRVVMVSVDPEHDTLDALGHYVKAFNPQFYGASGDEAAIHRMTSEFGIAYMKAVLNGHDTIEHTGTLILLNPKGELSAFFTTPHQSSLLAKDYSLLLQ